MWGWLWGAVVTPQLSSAQSNAWLWKSLLGFFQLKKSLNFLKETLKSTFKFLEILEMLPF